MEPITLTKLQLESPAFNAGEKIPSEYTCDGENINPELELDNIPSPTVSLALLMEDPDAPAGTWTHWLLWDIPITNKIEENSAVGVPGINDFGNSKYQGPCPPIGTHRYFFRVYALDTTLGLPMGSKKEELLKAMEYHVIGSGELMGTYGQSS
ncbi:YbhB/YbcL family Raf kinase inhibitor-like protein [Pontibacter sp. KCTC 32443]|uniref:YbhB/YbcL family Raf kinase inhibitor-like protein n=1 Tax=Pontibacter TaxID=323449 RepID=UPI00164E5DDC|nr:MULTISPECIES: YbhB/YbcL family Raf kinase inhibitor-like protein [Pontibacter]MBC5774743.1 YbhB/YbcL family Raf kinase inhibitor-like protein [Pontibacter sp. KCTC 32443]